MIIMYADDFLYSTEETVYDDSNMGAIKKALKSIEEKQKIKQNYYTITKPINQMIKGKHHRSINISYYGSGSSGSKIRNAVDGGYTNFVVGRVKDENNFFKVTMACGIHPNGPVNLFYNSPEEYESHQYVTLDLDTKNRWLQRKTTGV